MRALLLAGMATAAALALADLLRPGLAARYRGRRMLKFIRRTERAIAASRPCEPGLPASTSPNSPAVEFTGEARSAGPRDATSLAG